MTCFKFWSNHKINLTMNTKDLILSLGEHIHTSKVYLTLYLTKDFNKYLNEKWVKYSTSHPDSWLARESGLTMRSWAVIGWEQRPASSVHTPSHFSASPSPYHLCPWSSRHNHNPLGIERWPHLSSGGHDDGCVVCGAELTPGHGNRSFSPLSRSLSPILWLSGPRH